MALTDYNVHVEPSLPTLANKGDTIVDPTFGETILRLTDSTDGDDYMSVVYSNVSAFNCNSTRLFALRGHGVQYNWFCTFNPATMIRSGGAVQPSQPAGVVGGIRNFAHWHPTDPDKIYMHDDAKLWLYNVALDSWALVRDFSATLTGGRLLFQMSMSDDGNTFAWHTYSGGSGYIWYARDIDTVIEYNTTETPDEVEVDKSGQWLSVSPTGNTNFPKIVKRSDLSRVQVAAAVSGHRGMGNGVIYWGRGDTDVYRANLADVDNDTRVFTINFSWSDQHFSVSQTNARAAGYHVWSHSHGTYSAPLTQAFQQEITLVKSDAGADAGVYRLCHHRSQLSGSAPYTSHAFANWSRDGRFVAFNSNWGGGAREADIYIVTVPSALWADPPPRRLYLKQV